LFIRKGPVVQTRDPAGKIDIGADQDGDVLYDGPLVLLTSRFSASATEILVGALQDYGRAVVVGDSSTFGKGTVQNVVGLAPLMDRAGLPHAYDPGALKVTISKFYRPSGASTQLRGVASDIVLPSMTDFSDVSESALKDPLPWDVVPPAQYERLNRVQSYLPALRESSARRVKVDKDFVYLAGDIERATNRLAEKTVSLNEAERRHELAEAKQRKADREKGRRVLASERPVAHEITLENVDSPGLPPPKDAGAATTPDASAGAANGSSSPGASLVDDIILDESVRILADYVNMALPAVR
jgi:carboxyl-terminal processing protease